MDGDILTKTAVKWTSGINYSYGKTKLTKLSNDIYKASYLDLYLKPGTGSANISSVCRKGRDRQFYGYEYAGVDENGNMLILNDKDEQIPISQADAKYKRYIGNGAPKHFLSWSNNLTWRNFDLVYSSAVHSVLMYSICVNMVWGFRDVVQIMFFALRIWKIRISVPVVE